MVVLTVNAQFNVPNVAELAYTTLPPVPEWQVGTVPELMVMIGCITERATVTVRVWVVADGPLQPAVLTVTSAEPDQPAYQVTTPPEVMVGAVPMLF